MADFERLKARLSQTEQGLKQLHTDREVAMMLEQRQIEEQKRAELQFSKGKDLQDQPFQLLTDPVITSTLMKSCDLVSEMYPGSFVVGSHFVKPIHEDDPNPGNSRLGLIIDSSIGYSGVDVNLKPDNPVSLDVTYFESIGDDTTSEIRKENRSYLKNSLNCNLDTFPDLFEDQLDNLLKVIRDNKGVAVEQRTLSYWNTARALKEMEFIWRYGGADDVPDFIYKPYLGDIYSLEFKNRLDLLRGFGAK